MDIKALSDFLLLVITQYYPYLLAGGALLLLAGNNPVRHAIEKALSDNWQLTLLATTRTSTCPGRSAGTGMVRIRKTSGGP